MTNIFSAVFINIPDGMPIVVGILCIGVGIAIGQLLAVILMRKNQARRLRAARENGLISHDGWVVATYSKWGFIRKGYLLVDSDKIILQDRNEKVVREHSRSEVMSVNYKEPLAHNFSFIFKLKDGTSFQVYTYRPAPGNPYPVEIALSLQASKL